MYIGLGTIVVAVLAFGLFRAMTGHRRLDNGLAVFDVEVGKVVALAGNRSVALGREGVTRQDHHRVLREAQPRSGPVLPTWAGVGAAGLGLLLGGGAAQLLYRASAETLATTSRVLTGTGLAGLAVMSVVVIILLLARTRAQGENPTGRGIPTRPIASHPDEFPRAQGPRHLPPVPTQAGREPTYAPKRAA